MRITIGTDSFETQSLSQEITLNKAAIYTIWTFDQNSQRYPLLYIGETEDLETRIGPNHHKYQCWLNNEINGLFIGIKLMPSSQFTVDQRRSEEQRLINLYSPICNK